MTEFPSYIGIDLGTTYSCVGVWENAEVRIFENEFGERTTPSWVAFADDGQILIGKPAMERANIDHLNTLFDVKRLIGKRYSEINTDTYPYSITADENDMPLIQIKEYKSLDPLQDPLRECAYRKYRPEEISAMVLQKMKEIAENKLNATVTRAVITVPAYFNNSQKTATKNAAYIAGFKDIKIINEPTSACLCYGLNKKNDGSKVLIFDLGGGTFDVSVLNLDHGIFEVLATNGDTHLGGEDFDDELTNYVLNEFLVKYNQELTENPAEDLSILRQVKTLCEQAKRKLSAVNSTEIRCNKFWEGKDLHVKLTRNTFENVCQELFDRCIPPLDAVLSDAKLKPEDINEVVLVGGSTRIPKIQEMLITYFKGKTLNKSVNPDEAVAYGAAVQGAILSKCDESGRTKEILLLDVLPLSLGIETQGGIHSVIIERNSQVPCKKSKVYSTIEDNQTIIEVKVFEGEREFTVDNHLLATFELTNIAKQPRGVPKIEVTFSINAEGILNVKAMDKDTGNASEIKVSKNTDLSQEDINRMIEDAEKYKSEDTLKREALLHRNQFEKYLQDTLNIINNPDFCKDEEGKEILSPAEKTWVNQFVLNNMTWLEENKDLSKDKIELAQKTFTENSQNILCKVYTRKKQQDLKKKYTKNSDDIKLSNKDIKKLLNDFNTANPVQLASINSTSNISNIKIKKQNINMNSTKGSTATASTATVIKKTINLQ